MGQSGHQSLRLLSSLKKELFCVRIYINRQLFLDRWTECLTWKIM